MRFFLGLSKSGHARYFPAVCLSVNMLRTRKRDFPANDWLMDSGAFTELAAHGRYREAVRDYANQIRRWKVCGTLLAAVAQDYPCEDQMLAKTGLTVLEHQRLTIERYDALLAEQTGVYIMPVLQGWHVADYLAHLEAYGSRLAPGAWVGVGSVCKRQGNIDDIAGILLAIHRARPDLRLHGFGVKTTALKSGLIRELLHTADSMAWSYNARRNGRKSNDWRQAMRWAETITGAPVQATWVFA